MYNGLTNNKRFMKKLKKIADKNTGKTDRIAMVSDEFASLIDDVASFIFSIDLKNCTVMFG